MASPTDLAALADVKSWLGITNTTSDPLLSGLITAVSRTILGYLNRAILPQTHTEVRDGSGNQRLLLSEWPVISVTSLNVAGSVVAPCTNPPFGSGYLIDPTDAFPPGNMQRLTLPTQPFYRGMSNVTVVYVAGYQVTGEVWTVPATPYEVSVLAPYGSWASNQGVTYADGAPLVKVAAGPTVGQYAVAAGVYTFAAADAAAAVLISYGYVPAELRQACIEAVSERFKYKDRIGINSQSLAGQETISYSMVDLSKPVKLMLGPYQRVIQP